MTALSAGRQRSTSAGNVISRVIDDSPEPRLLRFFVGGCNCLQRDFNIVRESVAPHHAPPAQLSVMPCFDNERFGMERLYRAFRFFSST